MGCLLPATTTNKDTLIAHIDNLVAEGGTNFFDAIQYAFDAMD